MEKLRAALFSEACGKSWQLGKTSFPDQHQVRLLCQQRGVQTGIDERRRGHHGMPMKFGEINAGDAKWAGLK